MRKSNILYLTWVCLTIGLIYGIVHYGNRLQAPAALPKSWVLQASPLCPLFPKNELPMSLKQSGETLELALHHQVAPLSLHGKLKRDGGFRFAGEAKRFSELGCRDGVLVWEGRAGHGSIEGLLRIGGAECPVCPEPIRVTGRPHSAP